MENRVIEKLIDTSAKDGWYPIPHIGQDTGVDLMLEKDKRIIIIEAKGEQSRSKNVKSRVKAALGAIILDMSETRQGFNYSYCLAFPETESFTETVGKIPAKARELLKINIIFVKLPEGTLKILKPDTEKLIGLIHFDTI
jgi:hypothetical protein